MQHYSFEGLMHLARRSPEARAALFRIVLQNVSYAETVANGIKAQPEAARSYVPVLIGMLRSANGGGAIAAGALGKLGRAAESAVPALCSTANVADPFFQAKIAHVLGEIEFNDPDAIRFLHQALTNQLLVSYSKPFSRWQKSIRNQTIPRRPSKNL
jgi:hypothetical protein